jgi:hypothetical protein
MAARKPSTASRSSSALLPGTFSRPASTFRPIRHSRRSREPFPLRETAARAPASAPASAAVERGWGSSCDLREAGFDELLSVAPPRPAAPGSSSNRRRSQSRSAFRSDAGAASEAFPRAPPGLTGPRLGKSFVLRGVYTERTGGLTAFILQRRGRAELPPFVELYAGLGHEGDPQSGDGVRPGGLVGRHGFTVEGRAGAALPPSFGTPCPGAPLERRAPRLVVSGFGPLTTSFSLPPARRAFRGEEKESRGAGRRPASGPWRRRGRGASRRASRSEAEGSPKGLARPRSDSAPKGAQRAASKGRSGRALARQLRVEA